MSDTVGSTDRLQTLRSQLASAVAPAERVKAKLALAEELWHRDPVAAKPLFEQVVAEADAAGVAMAGGRAASILCEMLRTAGDLEGSARYAELLLRAADASGNQRDRACALNLVGLIHQERGELAEATTCFEEFLRISRATEFDRGEVSALNQLAGVYGVQGELEKALACYSQCLELSTQSADTYGRAIYLNNIGWTLEVMGRWPEATEHFHRAIALCEEYNIRDLLMMVRMELGELSLARSDHEHAALMFRAVINGEQEMQQSGKTFRGALANLGWTHFRSGDLARAGELLGEAARMNEDAQDRCALASVERQRAEVALAQGRLDVAGDLVERAARHAGELKLRKEQGEALRVKALLVSARDQPDEALEAFSEAESTLERLGDTYELALTRLQQSRLLVELGRPQEALPPLRAAARTFRRLAVVAEAEEAARLLYDLEVHADRDSALLQAFFSVNALAPPPERFVEIVLAMLCDNLRFEQGAMLIGNKKAAIRGHPELAELPGRRSVFSQTDVSLLLPVRQDRRLLGCVWLRRAQPAMTRAEPGLLDLISRTLAPAFAKLAALGAIEAGSTPRIEGLRYRGVLGSNREVLETLALVPRVAATDVPVLVRGESGSGKELIARALHESGPRADKPFVTVNCAAVPESLLEAEFFGVEAGAATGVTARPGKFEQAGRGTIFLDEIGDMSPALQARLLRAIEERSVTRVGGSKETRVDVRVVAATNTDLEAREQQGQFRRDLLYRLNTVQLVLQPLRQRREDIPVLTQYFIARTAQQYNRPVKGASSEVLALFAEYAWPGNIRQLQHVVERSVILAEGETIRIADLPPELKQLGTPLATPAASASRSERRKAADEAERVLVVNAITRANGNAAEAAGLAGYSRAQFYRLLRKHNISR